jgi:hypothetical protein
MAQQTEISLESNEFTRNPSLTRCFHCFPIPILVVSRSLRLGLTPHIPVQRPAGQPAAVRRLPALQRRRGEVQGGTEQFRQHP